MIPAVERRCERMRGGPIFPNILNENHLVDSLENCQTLVGHSGCVNTLRWNKSGTLLASGSDDRTVKIWRAERLQTSIETGHEGNVFAVEFLPSSADGQLVTGAADRAIFVHDLETSQKIKLEADGRIKRICTVEQAPFCFWAASERDGRVLQVDTRTMEPEPVVQYGPTNPHEVQVKSVAISEANSYLLAVCYDETPVRLFDRRNFDEPILTFEPVDTTPLMYHSTHASFNKLGTELVVNQGCGGGVVVFSLDSEKDPRVLERLQNVLASPGEPAIASGSLPYPELREQGSTTIRAKQFEKAIDFYSGMIEKRDPDRAFHSICYSNRATALLMRRQKGDTYACIRDAVRALEIHGGNSKAMFRLCKALQVLELNVLAKQCIEKYKEVFPKEADAIEHIEKQVDLLGGPRQDDDDDEDDEENPARCIDYYQRFTGPVNHQTDIKEANFFGSRDQYVVAGSDCGHMYIWNRDTSRLMGIWQADNSILNIVQPHPDAFLIASSGIDEEIRLWQPLLERPDEYESKKLEDPFDFLEKKTRGDMMNGMRMHVIRDFARQNPQCLQS